MLISERKRRIDGIAEHRFGSEDLRHALSTKIGPLSLRISVVMFHLERALRRAISAVENATAHLIFPRFLVPVMPSRLPGGILDRFQCGAPHGMLKTALHRTIVNWNSLNAVSQRPPKSATRDFEWVNKDILGALFDSDSDCDDDASEVELTQSSGECGKLSGTSDSHGSVVFQLDSARLITAGFSVASYSCASLTMLLSDSVNVTVGQVESCTSGVDVLTAIRWAGRKKVPPCYPVEVLATLLPVVRVALLLS